MGAPEGADARGHLSGRTDARGRLSAWASLFRRRLHERSFWAIQAAVLTITLVHVAVEASEVFAEGVPFSSGLHQLPVVLYLIPIVYAGLRYGFEGAALTGAWCILLTLPNIAVWHARGGGWVGELLYVSFVVATGIVVAVPVERERRQRERLAETSRRLALLNDVASALITSAPIEVTIPGVLTRLREVLGLDGVGIVWRGDPDAPTPERWMSVDPEREERMRNLLERSGPGHVAPGEVEGLILPLGGGRGSSGAVVVLERPDRPLRASGREVVAAVAGQVGVALENVGLHRQETERLRSYAREVMRAQEEERKRLARELHDTAAQELVRLSRGLGGMAEASGPGEVADRLTGLRALVGSTLQSVRELSRGLRPTILDDLGLVPALEWLTTELAASVGIRADFGSSGPQRRLAPDTELALFRIAQEALRNVERHAGATTVRVAITFGEEEVRLEVADDGRGFTPEVPSEGFARSGRLGILGMQERATLIGARLTISSRPGEGTRVVVSLEGPGSG